MIDKLEAYKEHFDESARLSILRALADQSDFSLNDHVIHGVLEAYAFNKSRVYVRNQLKFLANELGAIKLKLIGDTMIAQLLEPGLDHVMRRSVLEGVARPSPQRHG